MIKYIFCDIDGTLVRDDKSLSEENIFWIRKAVEEKGIHFAIATGRMKTSVLAYGQKIGVNVATLCLNGTYLADDKGNVFSQHFLNDENVIKALHIRDELDIEMLAVSGDDWYTLKHDGYLYEKKIFIYQKPSVVGDFYTSLQGKKINKLLFMTPNPQELEILKIRLRAELSDICLYGGSNFLEMMPGEFNKGTGIEEFCKYLNISKDEVMAIGDDDNDVEMLKTAGISVAMGNALDIVKQSAKYITDTNENDGVAKAIKRFVFEDLP